MFGLGSFGVCPFAVSYGEATAYQYFTLNIARTISPLPVFIDLSIKRAIIKYNYFEIRRKINPAYFAKLNIKRTISPLPTESVFEIIRQIKEKADYYYNFKISRMIYDANNLTAIAIIPPRNLVAKGKLFEVKSFNLTAAIDSVGYTWSAELCSQDDYLELDPLDDFIECSYLWHGYNFILIIESATRSRDFDSMTWQVSGRSKNMLLDARYNKKVTVKYSNTTARQIVLAECAKKSIVCNWLIDDFPVAVREFTNVTPLDVIKTITDAVGAAIQPTVDGGLKVCVKIPTNPLKL